MTNKYQRFVDTDSEINLNETKLDQHTCTEDGDIDQLSQASEDIGPVDNRPEEDVSSFTVQNHKRDNNNDDKSHRIEISQPDLAVYEDQPQPLTGISKLRQSLRRVLEHLAFRIFTILLVIADVILVIVDMTTNHANRSYEIVSLVIITYFLLECALRLFGQGPRTFVKHWIEVLDAVIILIAFVFAILPIAMIHLTANITFVRLVVVARLIRIVMIIRLISEKRHLEHATKQLVRENKRRYQKDGFDLDLCYITDRVIAMSFPSAGFMAFYRNPIKEVARFLDTKHKDHYMVFNLCTERTYDESRFHHRVTRCRIDDHNPPKLQILLDVIKAARSWLEADPENVIAVHCKGGKGRTGTVISAWLVEDGTFEEAKDSLEFFGDRRTDLSLGSKFQGVQTPSQSRYVEYFETVKRLYGGLLPQEQTLKLTAIYLKALSGIGCGDGRDLRCNVITDKKIWIYDFRKQEYCEAKHDIGDDSIAVVLRDIPVLTGDIKIQFFCSDKATPRGYDDCLFYTWFHTSFIEDRKLSLSREELDNPHKKKVWHVFTDEFQLKLSFQKVENVM